MIESTCFGLLRHGQTIWNQQGRIQGRLDSELTETGMEDIRRWAHFFASDRWDWARIVTSPAPRAQKTAEIINAQLSLPIETVPGLREQDWGEWEGLSRKEIEQSHKDFLEEQVKRGWAFRPPGGESRKEVLDRARSALADLGRRFSGARILVICHQGVIKALVYELEKRAFRPEEKKLIDKNSLQILSCDEHGFSAQAYNITPDQT